MTLNVILFGNSDIVAARASFVDALRDNGVHAEFVFLASNAPQAVRASRADLLAKTSTGAVHVVHSFDTGPNLLAGAVMASTSTPHMATITGRGQLYSGRLAGARPVHAAYVAAFRRSLRRSHRIVCQNSRDADYFGDLAIGPPVATVIGSGVDVNRYVVPSPEQQATSRAALGVAHDAIVVSLPTRMLKSKGVVQLLEAATALHRDHPGRYEFLLAGGTGPAWNPRNVDMTDVPIAGPTRFLGSLSDMAELYAATDILALPTTYAEGLPRVLLEAAGAGCQLLATPAPGCEDVIDSTHVGHLLATPPTAEAIMAGVLDRSKDLDQAGRDRRRALFLTKKLDVASIANQYAQIYRDIASG